MSRLNVKYGAVIFDDPQNPREGWAFSVAYQEAVRVRGMGDLPNDTLWWSNITYQNFYGATNAWRNPWLRHDKYLPIGPRRTLQEWGYDPENTNGKDKAQICATIFRRVMRIAEDILIPMFGEGTHFDDVFKHKTLREDMRAILPDLDYPGGEARTVLSDGRAFQQFTKTFRTKPKSDRSVMLQLPRLEYARHILTHPVPKGPFEMWQREDFTEQSPNGDPARAAMNMKLPVVAEVNIHEIDGQLSPVFAFGSGVDKNTKTARHWVAQPELILMGGFANLDIVGGYVGSDWMYPIDHLPDHVRAFLDNEHNYFSWSAGLVAEAVWRSMLLPEPKSNTREAARTSWQGLWLRSYDRNRLFLDGRTLDREDYPVMSYAYGWINATAPEEDMNELIQYALNLGYVPQLLDVRPRMWQEPGMPSIRNVWGGGKNSYQFASMVAQGMRWYLWNMDKLPLMTPDKRNAYVKKIMSTQKGKSAKTSAQ